MKTKPMANARFWTWHNNGWCKLTLRPLQSLTTNEGGPTDEGYSYTSTTWTHAGPFVLCEWSDQCRDCDGSFDTSGSAQCPLDALKATECPRDDCTEKGVPILCPDWQKISSSQFDYAAAAAGY